MLHRIVRMKPCRYDNSAALRRLRLDRAAGRAAVKAAQRGAQAPAGRSPPSPVLPLQPTQVGIGALAASAAKSGRRPKPSAGKTSLGHPRPAEPGHSTECNLPGVGVGVGVDVTAAVSRMAHEAQPVDRVVRLLGWPAWLTSYVARCRRRVARLLHGLRGPMPTPRGPLIARPPWLVPERSVARAIRCLPDAQLTWDRPMQQAAPALTGPGRSSRGGASRLCPGVLLDRPRRRMIAASRRVVARRSHCGGRRPLSVPMRGSARRGRAASTGWWN